MAIVHSRSLSKNNYASFYVNENYAIKINFALQLSMWPLLKKKRFIDSFHYNSCNVLVCMIYLFSLQAELSQHNQMCRKKNEMQRKLALFSLIVWMCMFPIFRTCHWSCSCHTITNALFEVEQNINEDINLRNVAYYFIFSIYSLLCSNLPKYTQTSL